MGCPAAVAGALGRDVLFVRTKAATFALHSIIAHHQRRSGAAAGDAAAGERAGLLPCMRLAAACQLAAHTGALAALPCHVCGGLAQGAWGEWRQLCGVPCRRMHSSTVRALLVVAAS